MEYLVLVVLVAGFALVYFKKESATEDNLEEDKNSILELEKLLTNNEDIKTLNLSNNEIGTDVDNMLTLAYGIKNNKSIYKYPIRGLDYPNHSKKDDIFLNFNEK